MTRKNYSNQGSRNNPRKGSYGKNPVGRGPAARPPQRQVSPLYKVDLMHHQLAGMTTQLPQHIGQPEPRYPHKPARPPRPPRAHDKKPHQQKAKKGYTNINLEVKEELYDEFVDKVKEQSKSPKEVLNQLISFYNMGKINI